MRCKVWKAFGTFRLKALSDPTYSADGHAIPVADTEELERQLQTSTPFSLSRRHKLTTQAD